MRLPSGAVPWAVSFLISLMSPAPLRADAEDHRSVPSSDAGGFQTLANRGWRALRGASPDSSIDLFMEAYRKGMSKDSLYFFLAQAALVHSALDTAMAFNLSIPSPKSGAFRDSVLAQRYQLYVRSGLARDAAALTDSMSLPPASPLLPAREFDFGFSAGYYREDDYAARDYPFGTVLGSFSADGPQYRNRARLKLPVVSRGRVPWSALLEYDAIKSYAKDSVDYRVGFSLSGENLVADGLSLSLTAEIGKVTGTGIVTAYKIESAFLSFGPAGITMLQGGLESEWSDAWTNRFTGGWISYYRDRSPATGKGCNYSLSFAAIRSGPIRDAGTQPLLYVDDVARPNPVHYRDGSFRDTIPGKGISTFVQYVSNPGVAQTRILSPQTVVTVLPNLGYSFPLTAGLSAGISGEYSASLYPDAYEWQAAALPEGFTEAGGDFRGLALNRADGRIYSAVLVRRNGGFQEFYGPTPMESVSRVRIDQQAGLDLSLRYGTRWLGAFVLNIFGKRNFSNLADAGPTWIPETDLGVVMKWSRNWKW
jgi:hypothetical protein